MDLPLSLCIDLESNDIELKQSSSPVGEKMDKENVSPTITEPPSVGPSSSVGKRGRGDNNDVR